MIKKIHKIKFLLLSILLLIVIVFLYFLVIKKPDQIMPEVTFTEPVSDNINSQITVEHPNANINTNVDNNSNTNNSNQTKTASSGLIKMSFLSQAPFANWDALHEDACEEASLIMVYHYYNKTKIISNDQGEDEIQKLIEYENANNYGKSITLSELSFIAKKYYNMNSGRMIDAKKETIIAELNNGKPVIVPAAGKLLQNPNFKNGGPNYHMLVIKGYDKNGFITNDPGTRKGEGFRYTYENLLDSIHDWDPNNILDGRKDILVFD